MSERQEGESFGDLPLDFTRYLSGRLGVEEPVTLSVLGSFLLSFEPTSRRPEQRASRQPFEHAAP